MMENKRLDRPENTGENQGKRDEKGRFVKGYSGNPGGRGEGVKNKATRIKQDFFDAFGFIGGIDGLIKWIKQSPYNKKEFYKMLLQILPKELKVEGDGITTNVYQLIQQIQQGLPENSNTPLELDTRNGLDER